MKLNLRGILVCFLLIALSGLVILLIGKQPQPIPASIKSILPICWALRQYAEKHSGLYPAGANSTEVLQQLIDDNDLNYSWVFFAMPGKTPPTSNKIGPENVCFDFTQGATSNSPTWLPVVFPTGYRVDYKTGEAVLLPTATLKESDIMIGYPHERRIIPIVNFEYYVWPVRRNSLMFTPDHQGIDKFEKYRQLTPNGPL